MQRHGPLRSHRRNRLDEVRDALRKAEALAFRTTREALQLKSAKGCQLSGGERQRIAIARSCRRAPVMLPT